MHNDAEANTDLRPGRGREIDHPPFREMTYPVAIRTVRLLVCPSSFAASQN